MSVLSRDTVLAGLHAAQRIQDGELPTDAELTTAPLLTGWALQDDIGELHRLFGFVTGHPVLPDGWCTTSLILAIDPAHQWARTVSRLYRLGVPLIR